MSNIDLKNKELSQYDTNEIKEFLKEIGLNSYIQNFEKYQIDGYDLCNLSDDLLKLSLGNNPGSIFLYVFFSLNIL